MNQEAIQKVMSVGNARVKLLLLLLKQEMPLDTVVGLKVTDLGTLKGIDEELGIVREYLNVLGVDGIKRGLLFPSKVNNEVPISRENARQGIQAACKKAQVTLSDLQLGLTWAAKAPPVIPEVHSMEELMKEIKTIQGEKPKVHKTA